MKKNVVLLLSVCLFMCCQSVFSREKIKGNGKIVTKEIKIDSYNQISLAGSMELIYEQKDGSPYLEVTVDENIFSYIKAEVKGKKLTVKYQNGRNNNIDIQPTTYKIKTNSPELVAGAFSGSGRFNLKNIQTGQNVKIDMAGSGRVLIDQAKTNNINMNLAGSGKIEINQLASGSVKGSVSGSGNIQLQGNVKEGKFEVSGSGRIKADDCVFGIARASVSGSGSIYLNVLEMLKGSVSGSGGIYYKGRPSVDTSVSGSGKVKSID